MNKLVVYCRGLRMNRSASSVWDGNQSDILCRSLQPALSKSSATISNLDTLTMATLTLFEMSANLHYSTRPNSEIRSSCLGGGVVMLGHLNFSFLRFFLHRTVCLRYKFSAFVPSVTFGSISDVTFDSTRLAIALLLTVT